MQLLSCSSRFVRISPVAGALLTIAVACTPITIDVQEVIQTRSCVDDAIAMQFRVEVSAPIYHFSFEGGSPNVLGVPLVLTQGISFDAFVVAELDSVDTGEAVTLRYDAAVGMTDPLTVTTSEIEFYRSPWQDSLTPDCSSTNGPSFELSMDPIHDLLMRVTNPGPLPLSLVMLELVNTSLLPSASLDWDDPQFNSLPWQQAVPSGTVLDAAAPPVEIDLPDAATGGSAVLCRFISVYDGQEVRGILQANLTGSPVAAQPTTWGAVKALYRK